MVVEVADVMSVLAAQRLARIDAMRREALAEAERFGRQLNEVAHRSVRLELAAGLRITEHAAEELLRLAEAVVHRYPAVLDSLSHARMTERHASILVDLVDEAEAELRDDLVARAVALAEVEPIGTFRRRLRSLVESARFVTLAERHEAAASQRRTAVMPADDGMAWLMLFGPAVEIQAIHGRITRMAKVIKATPDETRTLDQTRADVMSDLLIDGRSNLHPEQARGIRPTVVVTVPALALLKDGAAAAAAATGQPPTVEGVGPIPLERARELAGEDRSMMRILTHPETGMVLSVSRDRYEPPPWLAKLVKWRAERCMAPGCSVPASRCEVDHSIAWQHGGHTSLGNLCPLCTGHHTIKHHGGWTVRQIEGSGGALEWISPTGRRYVVEPERRVPVFRPAESADAPF
ncbi:HNH endonuclease signature motif containing protein [Microbacterium sp. 4R-513]|uniref:HNH endonuclease signature motif containing protein n=1 Tax=Microbacterium sp. 4R-513 TaxID=2567934 RepID=UPI001F49446A|nr:HNH endonuclease signature motif containing protein [Microbacterium sp. 4R-513]